MTDRPENYWDQVADEWKRIKPQHLWRTHSDAVNSALFSKWLAADSIEYLLKTDLFDEACTLGLYPLLAERARHVVGMDISCVTARGAQAKHPRMLTTGADVRQLPFPDQVFDAIVSNSTLDHFDSHDQIIVSLIEFRRVLKPGGLLLLTLDNLANPAIRIRSILPFPFLNRLGILPYTVGATYGPSRLKHALQQAGFEMHDVSAIIHCPRVVAVALAGILEKRAGTQMQKRFLRLLMTFERLSRWPTKYLSGHFIAVNARKPAADL